jgi:ABC-type Mn2+/Zn2+ transport system ATPase subunit
MTNSNDPADRDPSLLVRAERVSLGYAGHTILRDVDFELRSGEFWFLLGHNGTGKTTFLRAILGMHTPSAGTLWIDRTRAGLGRTGFVPQLSELNRALPTTVREFVTLGLVGIRTSREERRVKLERTLARVALSRLQDADYWSLSGGERQRALVARALIREPSLLVLDEPMNHLDPEAERALLHDLTSVNQSFHTTLLLVTHDVDMARDHATHIAVFGGGSVRTVRRVPGAPWPPPELGLELDSASAPGAAVERTRERAREGAA